MAVKVEAVTGKPFVIPYGVIVYGTIAMTVIFSIINIATQGAVDLGWITNLFLFFIMLSLRGRIRDMRGMITDGCNDCLCSFFCFSCSATQM